MPQGASVESLVERARSGDREAFEELVGLVGPRLSALLRSRMGSGLRARIDAEDALQETLARGFKGIGGFAWEGPDSFFRWLAGIAERVVLEMRRRGERDRTAEIVQEPCARDPSPSTALRREERFDRLRKALDGRHERRWRGRRLRRHLPPRPPVSGRPRSSRTGALVVRSRPDGGRPLRLHHGSGPLLKERAYPQKSPFPSLRRNDSAGSTRYRSFFSSRRPR